MSRAIKKLTVEMDDFYAGYGEKMILEKLRFHAYAGEMVTLLGENGAGKTTFFRSVMQLLPIQTGFIRILDREIKSQADRRWARSQMGYVPQSQEKGHFPISVFEAVLLGKWGTSFAYLRRPSHEDKELTLKILETVGLVDQLSSDCRSLSGGQKQRLHIARALVRDPKILLLDEPTTYLDEDSQLMLNRLILEKRSTLGITVIMITHERKFAEEVSDRIVHLRNGQIEKVENKG